MKNYVQKGNVISYTLGSGETTLASGKAVKIGGLVGVIASLARNGQTVFDNQASAQNDVAQVQLEGVFTLPKTTGEAWTQGAKVYWDNTAKSVTTTASGNTAMGYAWDAYSSGATSGDVLLARF